MTDEISIADAMKILGVTKATVYAHVRRGNLHTIKKKMGVGLGGQRVYLDRAEVISLRDGVETPRAAPSEGTKHKGVPKRARKDK